MQKSMPLNNKTEVKQIGLFSLLFEEISAEDAGKRLEFLLKQAIIKAKESIKSKISLRIVDSTAPLQEFTDLQSYIPEIIKYDNIDIKIAAGPILEGDSERKSPITEIAKQNRKNNFSLYIRPYAETMRWKTLSQNEKPLMLQIKAPSPLDSERVWSTTFDYRGYCYSQNLENYYLPSHPNPPFPEILHTMGTTWNSKFDHSLIRWEGRKYPDFEENVACYTIQEIGRLKDQLRSYDLYKYQQAEQIGISFLDRANEKKSVMKNIANLFRH